MNNCNICLFRIFAVSDLAKHCERCPVERENAAKLTAAEREPDTIITLSYWQFLCPMCGTLNKPVDTSKEKFQCCECGAVFKLINVNEIPLDEPDIAPELVREIDGIIRGR